ncbi:FecCD family ABC transporter permease [Corynebacterium halotolerans]|uniref:FecCD family ABC transporter permease n=1 Tax=Corynebacterium halotolerans TaxID=225326 RepID=UPI00047957ED|nr:iron ABC transporter permease [Corynebacterium halotolerans]
MTSSTAERTYSAAEPRRRRTLSPRLVIAVLALLCLGCMLAALAIGRYSVPVNEVLRILLSPLIDLEQTWYDSEYAAVMDIRLPRVLVSCIVGASLALTGATMQAAFQNPLASSQMLGVSAGASFGGVLAILFGLGSVTLVAGSFVGGVLALVIVLGISRLSPGAPLLVIVLAGLVVGAMFNAFVSFITYVADPYDTLPSIVFWLMGSLAASDMSTVLIALIPALAGGTVVMLLRWRLNILALGDEDARSLGGNPRWTRTLLLGVVSLMTAGAVAVAGVIGWVGLVIPHLARMLVGSDNHSVIPASALLGAAYLTLIDTLSRTVTDAELPIGILTAIIGAPFFVLLLVRNRKQLWGSHD